MEKYMVVLAYSRPKYDEFEYEYKYSNSIEELQNKVRDFIDEYIIMASEWEGGQVYDVEAKKIIGIIAFNGRYFNEEEAKKMGMDNLLNKCFK